MERQFFTVPEVSDLTGLSPATVYRAVARGQIPALRVAGSVRIPKWWVDQILSGQPA